MQQDLYGQIRIAIIAIMIVIPIGVVGFMIIEGWSFLQAVYVTIVTLSTVGYGDAVPSSDAGRIFTIFLLIFGIGSFTYAAQAAIGILTNPKVRDIRQQRRTQKQVNKLKNHYVICGEGELVDKTVSYLLQSAITRQQVMWEQAYQPIDAFLDRLLGDDAEGHNVKLRDKMKQFIMYCIRLLYREATLLDVVVVITESRNYAEHLRSAGLTVIHGKPSDEIILKQAGIKRAQAIVAMLNNDTKTLLTILTAHKLNPAIYITAAALDEELQHKMLRVGANNVVAPYDVAGKFLNNTTLRPAVSDYMNSILFSHASEFRLTQLHLFDDSPWIGRRLGALHLKDNYQAGIIGIQQQEGTYRYAPTGDYTLQEDEVLLAVAPAHEIQPLQQACREGTAPKLRLTTWQRLPVKDEIVTSSKTYTLESAEHAIAYMSNHFIICGTDRVAQNAIDNLNPERPFVIISDHDGLTEKWLGRGFRVIHGNPTQELTLKKAGIEHAQAIMVSLEDEAQSVLTVLTSRSMSRRLLITATADTDEMIDKLQLAGSDRVINPYHVAAQMVIHSTTRPVASAFIQYVLFNYQTGLETTEIYMESDAKWIGQTLASLRLDKRFDAGVIGIRLADRETFIHAPEGGHTIQPFEVLIIVTPMKQSDELRIDAHGTEGKRPQTLRQIKVLQTNIWTRDMIQELIEGRV